MNKQLKIWQDDFLRYYSKTSVMARVVIGACLSFAIAHVCINKVIKPQNTELKAINAKIQGIEVYDDVELTIADIRNSQRKINMQLTGLKEANLELIQTHGSLSKNDTGEVVLALRSLMEDSELKIVSEVRKIPVVQKTTRRSSRSKTPVVVTTLTPTLPSFVTTETYTFQIMGSYEQLGKLFASAFDADQLFLITNIKVERSDEYITDRNFNQIQALSCTFDVFIPYMTDGKALGK